MWRCVLGSGELELDGCQAACASKRVASSGSVVRAVARARRHAGPSALIISHRKTGDMLLTLGRFGGEKEPCEHVTKTWSGRAAPPSSQLAGVA